MATAQPIAISNPVVTTPSQTYDPTNGETPLTTDFANAQWGQGEWTGTGGSQKAQEYYAGKEFNKLFGRNPTQSELASLSGAYANDANRTNTSQGNQAVAQYFQNFSNTPDQINKANQDKYLKQAPQHYDAVQQQFQSNYGRAATQDELDHFGSLLASGATDAYGLQQFLQQQPEYQTKQNDKFQSDLGTKLAGYDSDYFSNNILPAIQEAYAKQGRTFDSSAFNAAATNAAEQQTADRGKYIAGLSASQYGGVEDRAYQDYASAVANSTALTNAGINATYSGTKDLNSRLNTITDYNTKQQAYNDYLAKYGKRSNGIGGVIGGVVGAGAGAYFGGPAGASAGWQIGSGVGNAAQNSMGGSY